MPACHAASADAQSLPPSPSLRRASSLLVCLTSLQRLPSLPNGSPFLNRPSEIVIRKFPLAPRRSPLARSPTLPLFHRLTLFPSLCVLLFHSVRVKQFSFGHPEFEQEGTEETEAEYSPLPPLTPVKSHASLERIQTGPTSNPCPWVLCLLRLPAVLSAVGSAKEEGLAKEGLFAAINPLRRPKAF